MYVEACCTSVGEPGRQGRLTLTGQAGAVLQESAQLALAWVRAHSWQLDLDGAPAGTQLQHPEQQPASHQAEGASCSPAASSSQWASCASRLGSAGTWTPAAGTPPATALRHVSAQEKWAAQGAGQDSVTEGRQSCPSRGISPAANWDVHVHLPAGAVQKDGPSAGITLAVALVSLFTGRWVPSLGTAGCSKACTLTTSISCKTNLVPPYWLLQSGFSSPPPAILVLLCMARLAAFPAGACQCHASCCGTECSCAGVLVSWPPIATSCPRHAPACKPGFQRRDVALIQRLWQGQCLGDTTSIPFLQACQS